MEDKRMDWLKAILEKASVTDGKLDVEALMKQVNAEFPKHAVPKKDFNDKAAELKAANDTIAELKKAGADNEELQKKIAGYETEIRNLKTAADNTRKEYTLKDKLKAAGVVDADYVIYKQGGLDKFSFDKDGNPIGVDDLLKPMKESSPHLFKAEKGGYNPAAGGGPSGATNPWMKDSYNLTEQGRIYRQDPAQARELAAAAGVKI